jgi:hypothetical protein
VVVGVRLANDADFLRVRLVSDTTAVRNRLVTSDVLELDGNSFFLR